MVHNYDWTCNQATAVINNILNVRPVDCRPSCHPLWPTHSTSAPSGARKHTCTYQHVTMLHKHVLSQAD